MHQHRFELNNLQLIMTNTAFNTCILILEIQQLITSIYFFCREHKMIKCLHYAINERRRGHWGNCKGCCVCVAGKKQHCKDVLFPALLIIDAYIEYRPCAEPDIEHVSLTDRAHQYKIINKCTHVYTYK